MFCKNIASHNNYQNAMKNELKKACGFIIVKFIKDKKIERQ